jgi:nucleotide-binding universal stress UspA family protein
MAARDGTPFVGTSGTANGLGLACVVSQARLSRKRLTHSRLNWNYVAKPDGLLRYAASRKEHDHGAIRRILRSTDFSDGSRHALDYARVIAPCYGATITLFHARAAPPVIAYSTGIPLMPSELITPDDRPEILAAAATTGSDRERLAEGILSSADSPARVPDVLRHTPTLPRRIVCGVDFSDSSMEARTTAGS